MIARIIFDDKKKIGIKNLKLRSIVIKKLFNQSLKVNFSEILGKLTKNINFHNQLIFLLIVKIS